MTYFKHCKLLTFNICFLKLSSIFVQAQSSKLELTGGTSEICQF